MNWRRIFKNQPDAVVPSAEGKFISREHRAEVAQALRMTITECDVRACRGASMEVGVVCIECKKVFPYSAPTPEPAKRWPHYATDHRGYTAYSRDVCGHCGYWWPCPSERNR